MPHPEISLDDGTACEVLALQDEEGVALVVPCLQRSWSIDASGTLLADRVPEPIAVGGSWYGEPGLSSLRLEPQLAFAKAATDVVLIGHAVPERPGGAQGLVGLRVGAMRKLVRVFGDRVMEVVLDRPRISPPQAFDRLPIIYERAYGGWDRRNSDPREHAVDPRNPVGVGFCTSHPGASGPFALPNFEHPDQPLAHWRDRPAPAGFGFIAPHWSPRMELAGTFDARWAQRRQPLLPADFDRRHFQSASAGLTAAGWLNGDEPVTVLGTELAPRLDFALPRAPAPLLQLALRARPAITMQTRLDTVVIDTDRRKLMLTWRGCVRTRLGMHDLRAVRAQPEMALEGAS